MNALPVVVYLFCGLLGLGLGSFINVVVLRLRAGQALTGRSACPHCHHPLAWYWLVPVMSYLWLGGRCHYCRKTISLQYPVVEAMTGALFVIYAVWFSFDPLRLLVNLTILIFLIIIFIYDLKYYLIPDSISVPGIVVAILGSLLLGMPVWRVALGLTVGAGIFMLQYLLSRGRWIGGGDIRLGALLGAYLAWPQISVGLFLAYMFGAGLALPLLLAGRKHFGDKLPFGTVLAAAAVITSLVGEDILQWYLYDILHWT
jgi:prepilin signal peptidase PulO-like enzyme (type II secretory pathway)